MRLYAESLKNRYYELKDAATSPGSALNNSGSAPTRDPNRRERLLASMIDAGQEAVLAELEYLEYRQFIFSEIIKLGSNEASALIGRYINEAPADEICKAWAPYNNNKPLSRRMYYRYIGAGKDNLREILKNDGAEIE